MFIKRLIFFILSVICCVNAQFEAGDLCETESGAQGVCAYEHRCIQENDRLEIQPSLCSYEGKISIVCCPEDYVKGVNGIINKEFLPKGVITNGNLTCIYDGSLPLLCCPTVNDVQPPEPSGCPPLPRIQTPTLENPSHKVAWEKCVANERYVNTCVQNGESYARLHDCHIHVDTQRLHKDTFEPDTTPVELPHLVELGCADDYGRRKDIEWVGGGSLISSKFILTAAHVLMRPSCIVRYALLGSIHETDLRNGELYGIIRLVPHPSYSSAYPGQSDIALLQLNRQVTFSNLIRPACLPLPGIDPENEVRTIAGFIENGPMGDWMNYLQKEVVTIVPEDECKHTSSLPNIEWDNKTMICARDSTSFYRANNCQGNSEPLMYKVTNEEFSCNYVVEGVASWSGECWRGKPTTYTNVSAYLDWIVQTVWPEEYSKAVAETVVSNI